MITAYVSRNGTLTYATIGADQSFPEDAVWIDALDFTPEEEAALERFLGLDVPNREEMQEIEISSRLYQEDAALFMTATLIERSDTASPNSIPVTFVLCNHRLVTLRYANPLPFRAYVAQVQRQAHVPTTGEAVLIDLLDAVVDRLADILERVQHDMDQLSREVFAAPDAQRELDLKEVLRQIGRSQELASRARESLVSIGRLLSYISRPGEGRLDKLAGRNLKTLSRDVMSLSDHASFLSSSINFQLDATLGLINIEQNAIIKIFSVAAVVFLPPTLVASVYGMNFDFMPELGWPFGYPFALALMVLSAILPYLYFKRRGWL